MFLCTSLVDQTPRLLISVIHLLARHVMLNTKCLISIEPALSTKKDTSDFWIPTEYLKKLKYNIDANYTALKTEIVDTDLNVSTTNIIRALKIMARRKGVGYMRLFILYDMHLNIYLFISFFYNQLTFFFVQCLQLDLEA
uniref:DDE_Tnp_1_7 domain-containing protein n=1 Tax=Heterorhabditis bacteriophora TaxID=37862 RepID=A0A1I7X9C2_HETBA